MLFRTSRTKVIFIPVIFILWTALRVVVVLLAVVVFVTKSSVKTIIYIPKVTTPLNSLIANATVLAFLQHNLREL